MKFLIVFLMATVILFSEDKSKTPTFKPTFIYERPDGSEYARIDGIEGWVTLKKSNKPNPYFDNSDLNNQSKIIKNEKGEIIVEVYGSTPLTPQATNNTSTFENMFSPDLRTYQVFPNPSIGNSTAKITLSEEKNVKVELFTSDGKFVSLVREGPLSKGENNIVVSSNRYNPGNYMLSISIDGNKRMQLYQIVK